MPTQLGPNMRVLVSASPCRCLWLIFTGYLYKVALGCPRKDCSIRLKPCVLILHRKASPVLGIKRVSPFFSTLGFKRPSTCTAWSNMRITFPRLPEEGPPPWSVWCTCITAGRCYRNSFVSLQNWQHKQEPGNGCYACISDYLTTSILN